MSELELTTALRALGSRLEETPDLVVAVVARLETEPVEARRPWRRTRRVAIVAIALLLLVAATAFASSRSLRDWLLDRGVDARPVTALPETVQGSLAELGAVVDAGSVAEVFGKPVPTSSLLGPPNEVRADRPAREVTLVWAETPALPASPSLPGVGALLTVWPAELDQEPFIVAKALAADTRVRFVSLPDGTAAVWIAGAPHAVTVFDRGTLRFRLAANVLIWNTADGLNHRLETTVPLARALAIAASFGPGR